MHIILLLVTIFFLDGTAQVRTLKAPSYEACQKFAPTAQGLIMKAEGGDKVSGVDARCIDIAPVKAA